MDIDAFRLDRSALEGVACKRAPRRKKTRPTKRKDFLKGPIPGPWLSAAGNLPGKALHVGLSIWLAHGVEKKDRFRLTPKWYEWFEIGPKSLRESLKRLRDAGLIRLESRPGCSPIVTLLTAPEVGE